MTCLQDPATAVIFLLGLLCSSSAIVQNVFQLPVESGKEEAQVRGGLFLLSDAVRRGDVSRLRSTLDRDYAEVDVTSGEGSDRPNL